MTSKEEPKYNSGNILAITTETPISGNFGNMGIVLDIEWEDNHWLYHIGLAVPRDEKKGGIAFAERQFREWDLVPVGEKYDLTEAEYKKLKKYYKNQTR